MICMLLGHLFAATLITTLEGHRDLLTHVLETARQRVVIVSPYISDYAMKSDDLMRKIVAAQDRGVEVMVYTDNRLDVNQDGSLKSRAQSGRKSLAAALTGLRVIKKIHAKILLADEDDVTIGSFNWLSALRDETNQYSNHEQSLRVQGQAAKQIIESSLQALNDLHTVHSRYQAFYDQYQILILSYQQEGDDVPPENYLELLDNFSDVFARKPGFTQQEFGELVVAAHQEVSKQLGCEDLSRPYGSAAAGEESEEEEESSASSDGTTSDHSLKKLTRKFEEMGIIDLVHRAVVAVEF